MCNTLRTAVLRSRRPSRLPLQRETISGDSAARSGLNG